MTDAVLVTPPLVEVDQPRHTTLVVAAVVALLALVVVDRPALPAHPSAAPSARVRAEQAGIDVDRVADEVSHRIGSTGRGTFRTGDSQYQATFDDAGFAVTPTGIPEGLAIRLRNRPAGPWRADGNVASRSLGPGMTEQVTASRGAVEWDVVLSRRPAGRGPLTLDARLDGLAAARASGGQWVLTLAGGGRLEMGAMVVKDRTGRILHRALPSIVDGHLSMTVPADVLDGARYPLTVDPTVSAERNVGPNPAVRDQTKPAVAWNGSVFLAVWVDNRDSVELFYATRISPTLGVLDPDGIQIHGSSNTSNVPSVSSNGTDFFVVWETASGSQQDIYGARVSGTGALLDNLAIPISVNSSDERLPSVGWNGSNYLVAWASVGRIRVARVNSAGTVLASSGFPLTDTGGYQGLPAVSSDGTNWFVAWEDTRNGNADIYGTRVANDQTILDGQGVALATGTDAQQNATVAWNGASFLLVWQRYDGSTTNIEGRRFSNALTALGSVIPLSSSILELAPSVAARGSTFLVTWEEFRLETSSFDTQARRVRADGTLPESDSFGIAPRTTQELEPAVVGGATSFLAVWQDQQSTLDIRAARVGTNGNVLDNPSEVVSTGPTESFQWTPAIAWNGSEFLVVWEDGRSGVNEDIYGARIDANGTLLDPTGIPIAAATDGQYTPAVTTNGSAFFVVWEDFRSGSTYDIYGSRVTAAGVVQGGGTPISTAAGDQTHVSAGFNGTNYVVAWQDGRSGTSSDIYSTRVSQSGSVLTPAGRALSTAAQDQTQPSVASTDGTTLVVWTDTRSGTADIRGTRVDTNGAPLDMTGLAVSTSTGPQQDPAVAWTDGTYFIAWTDGRSGVDHIRGTRLDEAGAVSNQSGVVLSKDTGGEDEPAVAFNGDFLVVWRGGGPSDTYDVFGTRVGVDGTVRDPNSLSIASFGIHEVTPAVSAGPGTTWGVTYARQQPEAGQGTYLRTVAPK